MSDIMYDARSLLKKHLDLDFAKEFAYTSHFNLEDVLEHDHPLAIELWKRYEELAEMVEKSEEELLKLICIGIESQNNE